MMIEKGHPPFDRVRHLHTIAEHGQDVTGQQRFRPEVKRLMDRLAPGELAVNVHLVEECMEVLATTESVDEIIVQYRPHLLSASRESIDPGRYEPESPLDAVQGAWLPIRKNSGLMPKRSRAAKIVRLVSFPED